jgi:lipopolysaccharide assembly outer membrane protein LptD (OstA)
VRRITIAALVLLTLATLAALALARQTFQATMTHMPQGQQIGTVARSIQRDSAGMHATGNVQVRITPIHPDEGRTVIHADEVIYHGDTGEIETRGDARITIEKAQ